MFTVNLPPEVENHIRRNAAERGQDAEQYLFQLIDDALRQPVPPMIPAKTSLEEFLRHIREVGHTVDPAVPPLSDEVTQRESIYDHEGLSE